MRAMRRVLSLLVLPLVLLLLLVGCGEEEKAGKPLGQLGDDAESSAKPSPGSTEPSADERPFDNRGHEIIRGQVEASTPEEQAVADAWFAYWDARADSVGNARVDPDLGKVAAGAAVADVVRYVTYLQGKNLHTVGDSKFSATDIEVDGNTATLTSCGVNKSIDQKGDGSPAEQLEPFYNFTGALTRVGGTWRVVSADRKGTTPCDA